MIPTVNYTNLEIQTKDLICNRVFAGPFPADWSRIVIENHLNDRAIMTWVMENTNGKFGIVPAYPVVAIYFEDHTDAILFRLKGGDEFSSNEF